MAESMRMEGRKEDNDRDGGGAASGGVIKHAFNLLCRYISAIHMHAWLQIIGMQYSSENQSVNQSAYLL